LFPKTLTSYTKYYTLEDITTPTISFVFHP